MDHASFSASQTLLVELFGRVWCGIYFLRSGSTTRRIVRLVGKLGEEMIVAKAWVMLWWLYGGAGVTGGSVGYFLSEPACETQGEKFKATSDNGGRNREYLCVEIEVREKE